MVYAVLGLYCGVYDCEINYTKAVSRQRLGKHVLAATDMKAIMAQQQRNGVFCVALCGRC
jgi:hypothetical protein